MMKQITTFSVFCLLSFTLFPKIVSFKSYHNKSILFGDAHVFDPVSKLQKEIVLQALSEITFPTNIYIEVPDLVGSEDNTPDDQQFLVHLQEKILALENKNLTVINIENRNHLGSAHDLLNFPYPSIPPLPLPKYFEVTFGDIVAQIKQDAASLIRKSESLPKPIPENLPNDLMQTNEQLNSIVEILEEYFQADTKLVTIAFFLELLDLEGLAKNSSLIPIREVVKAIQNKSENIYLSSFPILQECEDLFYKLMKECPERVNFGNQTTSLQEIISKKLISFADIHNIYNLISEDVIEDMYRYQLGKIIENAGCKLFNYNAFLEILSRINEGPFFVFTGASHAEFLTYQLCGTNLLDLHKGRIHLTPSEAEGEYFVTIQPEKLAHLINFALEDNDEKEVCCCDQGFWVLKKLSELTRHRQNPTS